MKAHRKLFRKLWKAFVRAADLVKEAQGNISMEWPSRCAYWRDACVRAFLRKHGMKSARVHGCMFGMKPKVNPMPGEDVRLHKVWRIESTSNALLQAVGKECDGKHKHAVIQGEDTKLTAEYPPQFCKCILHGAQHSSPLKLVAN